MKDIKELAASIRDKINKDAEKIIAKNLTSTAELLQVEDWVEMPGAYFQRAAGGPGFPCGHIAQIIGDPDTGKTTLVMAAMVSTQKSGGICFLIDSEHKFSFDRFRAMGGIPEDIIVISVDSLEEAWAAWANVCDKVGAIRAKYPDVKTLAVWDSAAASIPDAILDSEAGDATYPVEAKINNTEIRKLRKRIRTAKICAIFINHSYMTMPKFGAPKEVIKGGGEMYYQSTLILKTKRRAWLDRQVNKLNQRYGTHSHLEVFKGHLGGLRNTTEFYIVPEGIIETDQALKEYEEQLKAKD